MTGGRYRWIGVGVALAAIAATSCSGSDGPGPAGTVTPPTSRPPSPPAASAGDDLSAADVAPTDDQVGVEVSVTWEGITTDLGVSGAAGALDEGDPFGEFASCSGLRRSVGAFSVLVSDPGGAVVTSVSVLTVDRVDGPGIYDADLRIERSNGTPIRATGTLTLASGLRDGSFVAFDAAGAEFEGTFACTGAEDPPAPVVLGRADAVLDTVEVFVLLRRGQTERVLGLAVDAELAAAECQGAAGGSGPVVVRVDGDDGLGAITSFELTGGASPALRLRVGGSVVEVADVVTTLEDAGTSGTFTGSTAAGVDVDGAFRCT